MSPELIKQLLISAKMIKSHEGILGADDIDGVNNITELSRDNSTHIEHSIALVETDTERIIYVIVPGSNDREDWLANFQFRFQDMVYKAARQVIAQVEEVVDLPQAYSDIGLTIPHAHVEGSERWSEQRVHSGFMRSYYGIQDKALSDFKQALDDYPDAAIYGTAHSLGSAILRFMFLDTGVSPFFVRQVKKSLEAVSINSSVRQGKAPNLTEVGIMIDLSQDFVKQQSQTAQAAQKGRLTAWQSDKLSGGSAMHGRYDVAE